MRIGSLFTGTGALDMAARAVLGGEPAWVSDIKPAAETFLAHRHPDVPNIGDLVRMFPAAGPVSRESCDLAVEILVGGWPCQPHSAAGKRLGEADPRALWPNVRRVIAELRPGVFLGENVARIASNGELRRAVASLAALGYVGAWRSVTAAEVGAPHKRDRVFLVAVRADVAADALGLLLRDEPGRGGGPSGPGARVPGDDGPQRSPGLTLLPTPTQSMTTGAGTSGRDGGLNLQTAIAYLPTPAVADRWGRYAEAIARWEPVVGRPAPSPTVPEGRDGKAVLSPAFVEWMMGLPSGHVTDVPDLRRTQMLSMLGDGVVPLQAETAYRVLFEELGAAQAEECAA